tara:strand:- start:331 stop:717 length:387 start_codon:yes stop_codon:yes gene_type:complete
MSAPRMQPSGMVSVTSHAMMDGKLECFGYGQRDDIPNPGDLMIVTTNWIRENAKTQEIEFTLRIRGKDMGLFVQAASDALLLWKDNQHWLSASSSRLDGQTPIDTRSLSQIRGDDQMTTLAAFKNAHL